MIWILLAACGTEDSVGEMTTIHTDDYDQTRTERSSWWPGSSSTAMVVNDCYGYGGRRGGAARPRPKPSSRGAKRSKGYSSRGKSKSKGKAKGKSAPRMRAPAPQASPAPAPSAAPEHFAPNEIKAAPKQAKVDWGGTVYLSNDDSMSLASAQRTLFALERGQRMRPGEVRPHELLNYFNFDTADVRGDDMFSVLGSAEVQGDQLSMALAVKGRTPSRKPLDLTISVDRSGSMSGEGRMTYLQRGLNKMVDQLVDGDRIDLVLFDNQVCTAVENFEVGVDDLNVLRNEINRMRPRGGTNLDKGLREAYAVQARKKSTRGRNRRVMLITDAFLNSGNVNVSLVSEVGKQFERNGVRLTGVGVGRQFNDKMLDTLTEKGKGAYVYLGSEAVVDRVFGVGFHSLTQTIAHDVQFRLELPKSLAMERFYGEESSSDAEDVQPINYYGGTSQLFLQDLAMRNGRVVRADEVKFVIDYTDANTGRRKTQTSVTTVGALLNSGTANLPKAQALMAFADIAAVKAMGGSCDRNAYDAKASRLSGDAEIAYVTRLVAKTCGGSMTLRQTTRHAGVGVKLKVDSDVAVSEAALNCGGSRHSDALGSGDTVARFRNVRPGSCNVTLQGAVPMSSAVTVPVNGGDLRCLVRSGRMSCS